MVNKTGSQSLEKVQFINNTHTYQIPITNSTTVCFRINEKCICNLSIELL